MKRMNTTEVVARPRVVCSASPVNRSDLTRSAGAASIGGVRSTCLVGAASLLDEADLFRLVGAFSSADEAGRVVLVDEVPVGLAQVPAPAHEARTFGFAMALCVSAIAALLAFAIGAPSAAYAADNVQLDAPVTVSDDVTRVQVSKLDANSHAFVSGATMAIIDEETSEVVDSWVTGKTTHSCDKTLNVGSVYILRELSAPDGYEKIDDVRFEVNEVEGEGITVLSGTSGQSELTESYKLALYDTTVPVENVTTETRVRNETTTTTPPGSSERTTTSTVVAPKTGDETPLTLVLALMFVGISAILILQVMKRRLDRRED